MYPIEINLNNLLIRCFSEPILSHPEPAERRKSKKQLLPIMGVSHAVTKGHLLFEETLADPNSFVVKGGSTLTWEDEHSHTCWEGDHTIPRLIQTDQGFYIKFKWCTYGCLVNALCGKWCLEILFEKKGAGEWELPEPYRVKMVDFVSEDGFCYDVTCHIPPKVVMPGLYDICVCLLLKDEKGRPLPVAAFGELGMFHFYTA